MPILSVSAYRTRTTVSTISLIWKEIVADRHCVRLPHATIAANKRSLAGPAGRALFKKGCQPFAEIRGGSDQRALLGRQFQFAIDFGSREIAEQFLGYANTGWAARDQVRRESSR